MARGSGRSDAWRSRYSYRPADRLCSGVERLVDFTPPLSRYKRRGRVMAFHLKRTLALAAAAAALLAACSPAPEKVEDRSGLPMWVIKDNDSTIYLTGTVHMLPPDVKWTSPRLEKAMKDST